MKKLAPWIPLLGLSLVYIWFGIDKFVTPAAWIFWQPPWMDGFLGQTKETWNSLIGVAELVMVPLLLIPKTRWLGALAMTAYMLPIIYIGWPGDIAVRDIGLLSISLGAFFSSFPQQK